MPTGRGWTVLGIGLILWAASSLFGTTALEQLSFGLIALVIAALALVRWRRHELMVRRRITPERVGAGQEIKVTLDVANRGRGSAPLILMQDRLPLEISGRSRFALPGLEPGGKRASSYTVRPPRRGRYDVGPLGVTIADPFGLARLRSSMAGTSPILVHPRIEPLGLPGGGSRQRSASVSALKQLAGSRGEDFYTLREYADGDDLRKIHWPSTAKLRRYMIRQEETPWHMRVTVLIDDRSGAQEGFGDLSTFERTVEAAASVVALYHRAGYSTRLLGAHQKELRAGRGTEHFHRILDLLATIEPHNDTGDESMLIQLAALESMRSAEGTLVTVTGTISAPVAVALARASHSFRNSILVSFPRHRFGSASTRARWEGEQRNLEVVRLLTRSGIRAVVLGPGDSLARAWAQARPKRAMEQAWVPKPELV